MKKIYLILFAFVCAVNGFAQVNVTGDGSGGSPYATLADAINAVNAVGTLTQPTVISTSISETAPLGGYQITATGSAANTLTISGGSNTITAAAGQTAGSFTDAIFKIIGGDYITIQRFVLQENAANTTTTAGTNNMTEWGIALLYASSTNGAQNNLIQNNNISLSRLYQNTFAIYSNVRHTALNATTSAEVATTIAGSNSFNRVYSNSISNVNYGIVFIGAVTTVAAIDNGNDIGGASVATGNTLTNWGCVGVSISSFISVTGANSGIVMHQQINDNISYNNITSFASGVSGSMGTITLNGIAKTYASTPTGTFSSNIANNIITVTSAPTSGFVQAISSTGLSAQATSTLNIINNNIINCAITGAGATSGALVGITNSSAFGNISINNNIISGGTRTGTTGQVQGISNSGAIVNAININNNKFGTSTADYVNVLTASSGSVFAINNSGVSATCNASIQNNDLRGIVHSVAASSSHFYITAVGTPLSNNVSNNTFTNLSLNTTGSVTFINHSYTVAANGTQTISNNSIVTAFNKTGAGGTITLATSSSSSVAGAVIIHNGNNFSNITVTGATTIAGWLSTDGGSANKSFTNNTFSNWTGGTSSVTAMSVNFGGGNGGNGNLISGNTISNITSAGAITGISVGSSATTSTVSNNTIANLSSSGASAVNGITSSTSTSCNIFKNKIYNLSGSNASSTINGISVSSGTLHTIYNNYIGDLKAPAANAANPLVGLNITGGTTVNAYFNTVQLAGSSSGALFGSSAISASSTPALTLRNNIFVNNSSSNGAGLSVAYRRSNATLTSYNAASNKNLFFASTVYTDGTTPQATLAAYQALVAARDANSISENPNFLSINGNDPTFLHINTSIATAIDAAADPITGITDDFDGDVRDAATPDIGADEFTVVIVGCSGQPAAGAITPTAASKCVGQTYSMTATGLTTGTGISYQWKFATVSGGPYVNVTGGIGATTASYTTAALTAGIYYFVLETSCSFSAQSNVTNEVTVTVNALPTVSVTPTSATLCSPGGTPIALTASGASTYTWSPAAGLSATTGASVTANPTSTSTYTVTGLDGNGCSASATTTITVNPAPVITSTTATPATICSGGSSQLQVNVATPFSSYIFTSGSGALLDPMTGATTVIASSVDDVPTAAPASIGFTFNLAGTNYTQYSVSPDGWLLLGSTVAVSQFTNSVTSTTNIPKLYPYWDDLATGTDGAVKTLVVGSVPNRIFIVEWNVTIPRNTTGPATSLMQAWLYENGGKIEYRYGTMGIPTSGSISAGLTLGATNFQSITFSNNTSSGTTANDVNAIAPPSGTIYTYVPPAAPSYSWSPATFLNDPTIANPIATGVTANTTYTVTVSNGTCSNTGTVTVNLASYNSAVTTQPTTATVSAGVINAQVLAIDIPQACTAESLTQFDFVNASTAPADVANAKVYYTTTNVFSTGNLFGTTANPAAAFVVTGSQALSTTTRNYFWLVYDISCSATAGNSVDAGVTSFTVNATNYSPTPTNPTGVRNILATTSFNTVANGEWNNPATWACGNIPSTNATPVVIGHNVTVSNTGNIGGSVTINSGASLTMNTGGALTLGTVGGGNRVLNNNGTLSVLGGTLTQNGNISSSSASVFSQSGGNIFIDGNAAGVTANSVASGTALLQFNQINSGISLTGGTLTIVDPHAAATATNSIAVNNATVGTQTSTSNHTLVFGDGISSDAGGNVGGFIINPWVDAEYFSFGSIVVNGGAGTNRSVSNLELLAAVGNLTVNANSILNTSVGVVVGGNVLINPTGTLINTTASSGLSMAVILSNTFSNLTFGATNQGQTIENNGSLVNSATSSTANLSGLRIFNSSASGVTLNSPISVSGTLTFNSGIVRTTATNLLTLGFNATNPGTFGYAAGQIVGPFKRWINAATGSRQFPMGDGTNVKNANINFTTAPTTAGSLTANWSTVAPNFPNASPLNEGALLVNKASAQGSWFIDAADGLTGGTYTGTFTANGSTDVIDYTKAVLIKRPSSGGDWILDGTHVTTTGSNTAPVLSRTGMTGFSEFAIGGESNVVLPLKLIYFTATKQADGNKIDWKVTCISSPSVVLTVERSWDSRSFNPIYNLSANSVRCESPFDFKDLSPTAGVNYYRLKMVDIDGRVSYSQIVAIVNKLQGIEIVNVYPNPVKDVATLDIVSAKQANIEVRVTDISGRVVLSRKVNVNSGSTKVPLNMNNLSAGTYIVTVVAEGEAIKTTRVIKD